MKRILFPLLALAASCAFAADPAPPFSSASIITQNLVSAGDATAGSCGLLTTQGWGVAGVEVSGTYTGALSAQGTVKGTTWTTLAPTPFVPTTAQTTPTATIGSGATGSWTLGVAGYKTIRICALGAVTGQADIVLQAAPGGGVSSGSSGGGGGGAITAVDGAITAQGTTTDPACATDNGTCTEIALAKRANQRLSTIDTSINTVATTSTPVAPAAATATNGTLTAGQYNSAGVTLTNGQQAASQFDVSGNLKVVEPDLILGPYVTSANGDLFDIDTLGYESITVHVTTAGVGTHTFTSSHLQAATYVASPGYTPATSGTTIAVSTIASATGMLVFPTSGRFFKDTISGYIATPSTIYVRLSKKPVVSQIQAYITNGGFQTQASSISTIGLLTVCDARTSITAVATAQGAREVCTLEGKQMVLPYSIPETTWQYPAATSGIVSSTTAVVMKAAAASLRNYITNCSLDHDLLSGVSEVVIEDGAAAVLWRGKLQTPATEGRVLNFAVPLAPPVNSNASVRMISSVTGGVFMSCQGYQAP